jgi:hypothetical protein
MRSSQEPGYFTILGGAVLALLVLSVALTALASGGRIFGLSVDRRAVEVSRQYAESNTDGFYMRLEAVKKIDVQLSELSPEQTPQRLALKSQRTMLINEMRREVAKIPADARTTDMLTYEGTAQ